MPAAPVAVARAHSAGVTPGGVLAYGGPGDAPDTVAPWGRTHADPAAGAEVAAATRYDIASLTKPLTAAVLMQLVARGAVALDAPASRWLPELDDPGAGAITVRHLAGHGAGFPGHVRFYERLWAEQDGGRATDPREALIAAAAAVSLERAPGAAAVYSDVGYILLGALLERAGGARLDRLIAERITEPLGMDATGFVDLLADPPAARPAPVAPTEVCPRRGLVCGEVHDENAHAGGGVFGHAGLFSTAGDLARFARAVLAAAAGAPTAGLDTEVVRTFLGERAAPDTTWRLGWDTPSPTPGVSHAGEAWPRTGVGHLGFTGCSLWLDPDGWRYAVILTNRVHPSRDGDGARGIKELRRAVMDAIVTST